MFCRALHEISELFLYCGHGAGDKMCETYKMQSWNSCPAVCLWGCSSGRLVTQGVYDPYGPALNYLLGGAAFVVGNLWDVTDKDIDKLSMKCMELTFPDNGNRMIISNDNGDIHNDQYVKLSLVDSLNLSRMECKMKYIVGCSPVLYGLSYRIVR